MQVEQNQAHKAIESRDSDRSFTYADPPDIDAHQGHYGGYTQEHFSRDLDTLANVKGKFLLSTYPSDILTEYTAINGWHTIELDKMLSSSNGSVVTERKRKIEALTALTTTSTTSEPQDNCLWTYKSLFVYGLICTKRPFRFWDYTFTSHTVP